VSDHKIIRLADHDPRFCAMEDGGVCHVCGRSGIDLLRCDKPFSNARVKQIMDGLWEKAAPK